MSDVKPLDFQKMLDRFRWHLVEYETMPDAQLLESAFPTTFVGFVTTIGEYAERLATEHRPLKQLALISLERAATLYIRYRDAVEAFEVSEIESDIEENFDALMQLDSDFVNGTGSKNPIGFINEPKAKVISRKGNVTYADFGASK